MNKESAFFLSIKKTKGCTSFDVVRDVRRILGIKKVGHTGTLDPLATGVLPIAVGSATRLIQYLQQDTKEYIADLQFGSVSSTGDAEGDITDWPDDVSAFDQTVLESALALFLGEKDQIPPKASAVKIKGKRAYDLHRQGIDFEITPRPVVLHEADVLSFAWPKATIRIVTGKGYYVRSLIRDVGEHLQVGAYMTDLLRSRVGSITVDDCYTTEELAELVSLQQPYQKSILTLWGTRAVIQVSAEQKQDLLHGKTIAWQGTIAEPCIAVVNENEIVGLVTNTDSVGGIKLQRGL